MKQKKEPHTYIYDIIQTLVWWRSVSCVSTAIRCCASSVRTCCGTRSICTATVARVPTHSTKWIWSAVWTSSSSRAVSRCSAIAAYNPPTHKLPVRFQLHWREFVPLFFVSLLYFVPSVLWCCWLGGRKGIWPVKLSGEMVQLMPPPPHHLLLQKNPEWFTFLVPAYPGCPGKGH